MTTRPIAKFRWMIHTSPMRVAHSESPEGWRDEPREVARTLQQAFQSDSGLITWEAVPEVRDIDL